MVRTGHKHTIKLNNGETVSRIVYDLHRVGKTEYGYVRISGQMVLVWRVHVERGSVTAWSNGGGD